MDKPISTGIIGFGIAGKVFHAPFISANPCFHLSKISTSNEESVLFIRKNYPQAEIVWDAKVILDDSAIELVIIGTPNQSHFSVTKAALLSGKHVIVEKPFTVTTTEADELIALAATQKKVLTVHHNRRWDSDYKTVKKIIENKLLGNLIEYEAHFDRFRPVLKEHEWREEDVPGSGILYDLGSHLIDQAVQLFGLPQEITADIRKERQGAKTDDYFDLGLFYPNLKVILKAGMLVENPGPHFILTGERGSFIKYGMDVQEVALKAGQTPATNDNWGVEPEYLWGKFNKKANGHNIEETIKSEQGSYQDFFINVYKTIKGEDELYVKATQARDTIRIIELAIKSNYEKQKLSYSH
ncbi:MAG: oxidoreductase [Bacteroidia bacterium]